MFLSSPLMVCINNKTRSLTLSDLLERSRSFDSIGMEYRSSCCTFSLKTLFDQSSFANPTSSKYENLASAALLHSRELFLVIHVQN